MWPLPDLLRTNLSLYLRDPQIHSGSTNEMSDPTRIWTGVAGMKTQCPRPLDDGAKHKNTSLLSRLEGILPRNRDLAQTFYPPSSANISIIWKNSIHLLLLRNTTFQLFHISYSRGIIFKKSAPCSVNLYGFHNASAYKTPPDKVMIKVRSEHK